MHILIDILDEKSEEAERDNADVIDSAATQYLSTDRARREAAPKVPKVEIWDSDWP